MSLPKHEPFGSPFAVRLSNGGSRRDERFTQDRRFDPPFALSLSKGRRFAQHRRFDPPFALSLSKGRRFTQDRRFDPPFALSREP